MAVPSPPPVPPRPQSEGNTQKELLYSKITRYVPIIAVLLGASITSGIFLLRSSATFGLGAVIFVVCLPTAFGLASYFVGNVFRIYNHEIAGIIFRSFVAPSSVAFLLLDSLFSVAVLVTPAAIAAAQYLLPIYFAANALILNRLGGMLISGKSDQYVGLMAKRLALTFAIFFFAFLFSISFILTWLGYAMYYVGAVYGILSIAPVIAYSKRTENFREAGKYLMKSTVTWAVLAFFVGIGAYILTFFSNNIVVYAVVLTLGAILIAVVGLRVYSLGASRIEKETLEVYQRHSRQVAVVPDQSFDFLRKNINEFVSSGKKENLLIALTALLTNAGLSFDQSELLLREIARYEIPPMHTIPYLTMRKSVEMEVQRRITLVNETFNSISEKIGAVKTN
jgi:hypothetical protein